MFTFAEGFEVQQSATATRCGSTTSSTRTWPNVERVSAIMPSVNKQYLIGSTATIEGTTTTFNIDGANVVVNHMPGYFDFFSSNPTVARGRGEARSASSAPASTRSPPSWTPSTCTGRVIITSFTPPPAAAPVPTVPAADVISLYSDTYVNRPVDSFNPHWGGSTTQNETYLIDGNANVMYTTLNFVGIDFATQPIDVTEMTHLHLDVYAPVGTNFRVKLVAFGDAADGRAHGSPSSRSTRATTPAFAAGGWSSLEIPMATSSSRCRVRQHRPARAESRPTRRLVLVDNIYWHR